jgi:tetratricopeptide (TPR) repeat protein
MSKGNICPRLEASIKKLSLIVLITLIVCTIANEVDSKESVVSYEKGVSVFYTAGKEEKALEELNGLIQSNPDDKLLYSLRGSIHHNRGSHDKALDDYSRWIRIAPDDPEAYIARGDAYVSKDNISMAIEDFCKAVKLDSNHVAAKMKLEWAKKKAK